MASDNSGAEDLAAPAKRYAVRANRFDEIVPAFDLRVKYDEHVLTVLNISESGVRIEGANSVFENADAHPIKVVTGDNTCIYDGFARVAWSNKGDNGTVYGLEFKGKLIERDFLKALDQLLAIELKVKTATENFGSVSKEFRNLVYEIKNFFRHLKAEVDLLEDRMEIQSQASKESLIRAFDVRFGPYVTKNLMQYGRKLFVHLDSLNDPSKKPMYLEFFRHELNEYYLTSPYARRAMEKPYGYAGDFEMMNQVYRDNYEGKTLFAKLIHKYTISETAAQAVRDRKEILAKKIAGIVANSKRSTIKICSLASGPAQELVYWLSQQPQVKGKRIEIYLIDHDVEALLDCRRNLASALGASHLSLDVHCWPMSIKHIMERSHVAKDFFATQFDFIYSAGLYDYLMQPVAQMLTHLCGDRLLKDGELFIGNFHPNNPTRAISEFSVDWKLIHRTEDEMKQLAPQGGFEVKVGTDPQQVVVYLEAKKVA